MMGHETCLLYLLYERARGLAKPAATGGIEGRILTREGAAIPTPYTARVRGFFSGSGALFLISCVLCLNPTTADSHEGVY